MSLPVYVLLTLALAAPFVGAHAQVDILTVETSEKRYEEGDTIVIFGSVPAIIEDYPILLQIIQGDGARIYVNQIQVADDRNYSHIVPARGDIWKAGEYTVMVHYSKDTNETTFRYVEKPVIVEASGSVQVDAGSGRSFVVEYVAAGMTINDIRMDQANLGMVIGISAEHDGYVEMDLSREYVGASGEDGRDIRFIVLVDDENTTYRERIVHDDFRTIKIDVDSGSEEIRIIGTYAVPEFGVVLAVMMAGVATMILAGRLTIWK